MATTDEIRVGKVSTGTRTAPAVGVASAQLLAANTSRIALIVTGVATNRWSLDFGTPAVLDTGVNIPALSGPVILRLADFGTALTGVINAIGQAAINPMIIELTTTAG
jgi:hypothetical protein